MASLTSTSSSDPWATLLPPSNDLRDVDPFSTRALPQAAPPPPPPPPASIAQAYTRFLIHNAQSVASAESAVRSATYLLPGRFEGAEIASEGVFSLLTLLHALHSHLLHSHLLTLPPHLRPNLPPPTEHDRYTRAWSRSSLAYRIASGALVGVGGVQLLGEMIALKGLRGRVSAMEGKRNWERRWKWLVGVEGTKSALRLILLFITQRPLLQSPIPSTSLEPALFSIPSASSPSNTSPPPVARPKDPVKDILIPKTLYATSLTPARQLLARLSPRGIAGEVLHALKGLLYVLMLRTRSTSLPVLAALAVQLLSRYLLRSERKTGPAGALEREELARRDKALGGLAFRGIVWNSVTKPTLESVARKTQRIPLIGLVGGLLADYVPLIDEYYYYTES